MVMGGYGTPRRGLGAKRGRGGCPARWEGWLCWDGAPHGLRGSPCGAAMHGVWVLSRAVGAQLQMGQPEGSAGVGGSNTAPQVGGSSSSPPSRHTDSPAGTLQLLLIALKPRGSLQMVLLKEQQCPLLC